MLATAAAMRAMGATINRLGEGHYEIYGVGVGGLMEPDDVIDMGNSGTSTRLLMGLIASHDITVIMTGDASLRSRPYGPSDHTAYGHGRGSDGARRKIPAAHHQRH